MPRQFLKRNIDSISSKMKKTPNSQSNTDMFDQETLKLDDSKISSSQEQVNTPKLDYDGNVTSATKVFPDNETSGSYQSAYDTISRDKPTIRTGSLSKNSEYELRSQEDEVVNLAQPVTYQSYSSLSPDGTEGTVGAIPSQTSACIAYNLFRLWKFLKRILDQGRSRQPSDLENQPLIPPTTPTDQDETDRYIPWIGNYTLFVILTLIIVGTLIIIILVTRDTNLLIKVLQGIICYLLGEHLSQKLFGSHFCPKF